MWTSEQGPEKKRLQSDRTAQKREGFISAEQGREQVLRRKGRQMERARVGRARLRIPGDLGRPGSSQPLTAHAEADPAWNIRFPDSLLASSLRVQLHLTSDA